MRSRSSVGSCARRSWPSRSAVTRRSTRRNGHRRALPRSAAVSTPAVLPSPVPSPLASRRGPAGRACRPSSRRWTTPRWPVAGSRCRVTRPPVASGCPARTTRPGGVAPSARTTTSRRTPGKPPSQRRPRGRTARNGRPPPRTPQPVPVSTIARNRRTGRAAWSGTPRPCTSPPGTPWWTAVRPSRLGATAAGTPASGPRRRRSGPGAAVRMSAPARPAERGASRRNAPEPGTATTGPAPATTGPGGAARDPGRA